LTSKEEIVYSSWENIGGATLTVDGKPPQLTINVTQTGVSEVNLVGTLHDSGLATITITSTEVCSLDNVYVENSGQDENFLPPIAMSTTDNIVWTGTFTVENWDDNSVAVRCIKATDAAGNENTAEMENSISVDTRGPLFLDNGNIVENMDNFVQRVGSGENYRYADNDATHLITVIVEDNVNSSDNDEYVESVTVNGQAMTRDPTDKKRWTKSYTFSEGYNAALTIIATDRMGNTIENTVENIFIDSVPPAVTFNTITSEAEGTITWDENGELTNDTTPTISLTITDAGLGVHRDNVLIALDNDDNILNSTIMWGDNLENSTPWVWSVSSGYTFENELRLENDQPLPNGTYWIVVAVSDNLIHENENQYFARSFTIDNTKPTNPTSFEGPGTSGSVAVPYEIVNTSVITIQGTTSANVTVKIWVNDELYATTTSDETTGIFTYDIALDEGVNKIEISSIDEAGNETTR
jgi:hypothetical protein